MFKRFLVSLFLFSSIPMSVVAAEIPIDAKLDYNQGIDFYKLGMYERSIESFRSAVRTYPDYVDAYYNLGTVLEYLKQYEEAISVYNQVYVRNPNDYEVVYKLAYLNSKQGNIPKAVEFLKLIPTTNSYYQRGQELAEVMKVSTTMPTPQINHPTKVAVQSGIYENIESPTGVTADKYGNVYVATFASNSIIKITPDGRRKLFLKHSLIDGPISLASDNIGNIYISNYNANNVLKVTPQGAVSILIDNIQKPYGLHVEGNMLLITSQGSNAIFRRKI